MPSTAEKLERTKKDQTRAKGRPGQDPAEFEFEIDRLAKKLKEEENKSPRPHSALQFGPICQTIAIMSVISLGLSIAPLPSEMVPFYTLFSRITIIAVTCLVVYTSIIYYGYKQALSKLPKTDEVRELEMKLRKMRAFAMRPNVWSNPRSHPSAFLTTKHAPPRLFPFPLGKSRPEATVDDELWWEGGNAPHVGHFNKPPPGPQPGAGLKEYLTKRAHESMAMEKQRKTWKRRIRAIQILSCIVITAFVNKTIAIAALCWLLYSTISQEIETMLQPPDSFKEIEDTITKIHKEMSSYTQQTGPTADKSSARPDHGMGYIYDPTNTGELEKNSNAPIVFVPPPVLMTSESGHLAGPGWTMSNRV